MVLEGYGKKSGTTMFTPLKVLKSTKDRESLLRHIFGTKGLVKHRRSGPWHQELCNIMESSRVFQYRGGPAEDKVGNPMFSITDETRVELDLCGGGEEMELTKEALAKINEEVTESMEVLHKSVNDVRKTVDMLLPTLSEMVRKIRDNRMAVVGELKQSLTMMQDVRKFFLDKDHEKEMARLKDFLETGERLKVLIDNGTLGAISDAVLHLEMGNEEQINFGELVNRRKGGE